LSRPRIVLPIPPSGSKLERDFPVAVVVGASRGLGLLVARELDREGFRVVIASEDREELDRAAEQLRVDGARVATEFCDVADEDQVEALIERIETGLGPIEVLICVAGVIQVGPLSALRRSHFTEAIDVMLWGPINCGLAMAPRMRERGHGRIGVVTSVGGRIAAPHLLPYSTAKFGAVGFTRGLRSELAGTGVSVTCVEPGLMRVGSHLRARFVGNQTREYSWFATASSLPLLTIDAERAAVRIVRGVLSGRAVVTVTPLAMIAPRVDAMFPGLGAAILGLTTRLLPDDPGTPESTDTLEGWEAAEQLPRRRRLVLDRVTRLSAKAAERHNEQPESGR
jgi:NAD(P)-dependent dehydrogenase (short-subunit alcohol dehydrogenase family)